MSEGDQEFYRPPLRWFAVYVRSRHEARVAQRLAARDVEFFLPMYKDERHWSDRRVNLICPLFPGYIFVRIRRTLETLLRVVEIAGVITIVGRGSSPEALEDEEIELMKQVITEQTLHAPRPHAFLHAGDRVKVTRGALQGREGFLVREKNKSRVVISLKSIGRAMSVEVDADAIAPVGIMRRIEEQLTGADVQPHA